MTITVILNGGPVNVWHIYGLKCNPFPQFARAEMAHANRMLQQLDSDPLTSTDDIRRILAGCDQDFIDGCCARFEFGRRVHFQVSWPGKE